MGEAFIISQRQRERSSGMCCRILGSHASKAATFCPDAERLAGSIYNVEIVVRGKPFHTVATVDRQIVEAEHIAIVFHQRAEGGVSFHIVHVALRLVAALLSPGKGDAVDAHAPCQVGNGKGRRVSAQLEYGIDFVLGGGLRRALLTVKPWRKNELVVRLQRRPFLVAHPPTLYLLHGSGHINRRIPRGREQQARGIVV